MLYERIFREFQQREVRYAVIGGIAVNLYGYNRVTGDLDILISLSDENISKVVKIATEFKLIPRLPVAIEDLANKKLRASWVTEKNLKVFTIYNPDDPLEHIDIKISKPDEIEPYLDRAVKMEAGDLNISVVSFDDLITLKQEAGRERDFVDIRALQKVRELDD